MYILVSKDRAGMKDFFRFLVQLIIFALVVLFPIFIVFFTLLQGNFDLKAFPNQIAFFFGILGLIIYGPQVIGLIKKKRFLAKIARGYTFDYEQAKQLIEKHAQHICRVDERKKIIQFTMDGIKHTINIK